MVGYADAKAIAKDVSSVLKKAGEVETQKKFLELEEDRIELRRENLELKEQVKALEEKLQTKQNASYLEGAYWVLRDNGSKDGPFCQRCFEVDHRLVHLQDMRRESVNMDRWDCIACVSEYLLGDKGEPEKIEWPGDAEGPSTMPHD